MRTDERHDRQKFDKIFQKFEMILDVCKGLDDAKRKVEELIKVLNKQPWNSRKGRHTHKPSSSIHDRTAIIYFVVYLKY